MSGHDLHLKHYWRSSCSWRVRWALSWKKLPFRCTHVDLLQSENHSKTYLQENPFGYVPVLLVDDVPHFESLAIIAWLEETYPQHPLLPIDPPSRLLVRQLTHIIAMGVQPLQNMYAQRYYSANAQERQRYACHYISRGFSAYEHCLVCMGAGTYSFGERPTVADLCLVPQVYNALRFSCDMSAFPNIMRIYQTCQMLKSCQISSPAAYKP